MKKNKTIGVQGAGPLAGVGSAHGFDFDFDFSAFSSKSAFCGSQQKARNAHQEITGAGTGEPWADAIGCAFFAQPIASAALPEKRFQPIRSFRTP